MDGLGSLIIRQIFSESMKAGQMETKDNRRAVEAVEKEIENIARLRFSTVYEKRTKSLKEEIEIAKNELTRRGLGHGTALIKKLIALHSKAVRDTTFEAFHGFKEEYLRHYLSTSEQFLDRLLKAFEELIEDRFSEQKKDVKEEVLRTGLGDSLLAWALNEMDEEKTKLSAEIMREIETIRSQTKIQALTAGRSPHQSRTIQINISGGQIGVLNVAGMISAIEQNLSIVNEAGNEGTVEAIKSLVEAVMASKDLKEGDVKQALEHLEFLSTQSASFPEKRSKSGVVSAVLSSFRQLISTTADLSQIWSTWGPKLEAALRSMGII